jgi:hypothetical protein
MASAAGCLTNTTQAARVPGVSPTIRQFDSIGRHATPDLGDFDVESPFRSQHQVKHSNSPVKLYSPPNPRNPFKTHEKKLLPTLPVISRAFATLILRMGQEWLRFPGDKNNA